MYLSLYLFRSSLKDPIPEIYHDANETILAGNVKPHSDIKKSPTSVASPGRRGRSKKPSQSKDTAPVPQSRGRGLPRKTPQLSGPESLLTLNVDVERVKQIATEELVYGTETQSRRSLHSKDLTDIVELPTIEENSPLVEQHKDVDPKPSARMLDSPARRTRSKGSGQTLHQATSDVEKLEVSRSSRTSSQKVSNKNSASSNPTSPSRRTRASSNPPTSTRKTRASSVEVIDGGDTQSDVDKLLTVRRKTRASSVDTKATDTFSGRCSYV